MSQTQGSQELWAYVRHVWQLRLKARRVRSVTINVNEEIDALHRAAARQVSSHGGLLGGSSELPAGADGERGKGRGSRAGRLLMARTQ